MAETLGSRLKQFRKKLNLKQQAVAEKLSTSVSYISEIESDKKLPGSETLISLRSNLGINIDWLLSGEGLESNQIPIFEETVYFPFYNAEAAAGCGCFVDDNTTNSYIPFNKKYLKNILNIHTNVDYLQNLSILCVRGDSMEPTLKNGDMILVDNNPFTQLKDGIYIINQDETIKVKRVEVLYDSIIKITSDNKIYEPYEIDYLKHSINFQGKVIWSSRKIL